MAQSESRDERLTEPPNRPPDRPPDEPPDDPPDEPMAGLLRKASPGGDILAQQALGTLQARLFGRARDELRIGRYVLEDRIGAGGSGVVHRAFDPKHERKVALKLLHAVEWRGFQAARERLLREAQALSKLDHPNVVRIFDVGTYDPARLDPRARMRDEGVFLAMELLDGSDLSQWLAQRRRGFEAVREVFLAAGRGLAAAHAQGIIHRDFKPANVSVDTEGHVRVLDFGLARPMAAEGPDPSMAMTAGAQQRLDALARPLDATLTAPGTLLGTPAYMAPEQHERQRATARSDQYSFCMALYEAWYGQRPFLAGSEQELRQLKQRGAVLAPPAAARVPPHCFEVLQRGLSPSPEARFESMDALLDALLAPAPPRQASPRAPWVAAAGVAAILAVGAGVWVVASDDQSTRQGETQPQPQPEVELHATMANVQLLQAQGRLDEALPLARRAHELAQAQGDASSIAEAAASLGHLALARGHLEEAEAALTEALWSGDTATSDDAALHAMIDLLALATRASPRPADAPVWSRLARERAAMPSVPTALRLRLHLALAELALADGDRTRARASLQQALELPDDDDDDATVWRAQAEHTLAQLREPSSTPPEH